ncbi:MAG: polysaccharide biosynthesis protein [Fretibacterium sp.]|nr:polysaccharide biosynthesis protein [Fretibacterium sp.]
MMLDVERFIEKYVTKREQSLFLQDMEANRAVLEKRISGKSLLVIGGAGSIGSSFIRSVLPFRPSSLVVVDTNENALTELTRDLRSTQGMPVPNNYLPYPMDFASPTFERMFRHRGGFDIVANFSAHKHVRSEKDIFSIEALVRNNLLNARRLLDLMAEFPPGAYFCVSTDKAANPVNIMGASKRIMEDLIFSYSDNFPVKTARFANVAFSNGSLPTGFLARLAKLQPLSAPLDVRRYFVSPEESGQICMLACFLGKNREIFFPRLERAQMMSFDEIATALLRECGYNVLRCGSDQEALERAEALRDGGKDYPVRYEPSATSGEKPFEEFFTEDEPLDLDRFAALGVITGKELGDQEKLGRLFDRLERIFAQEDASKNDVVVALEEYLPNFRHIEKGHSLDEKM